MRMTMFFPQRTTQGAATPELAGLRARELDLRDAVAKLKAQQGVLETQAQSGEGYLRIPAQMQLAQVKAELASTQAELMSVQSRIQLVGGQPVTPPPAGTTQPPPPP